jgi:hypothetical protein
VPVRRYYKLLPFKHLQLPIVLQNDIHRQRNAPVISSDRPGAQLQGLYLDPNVQSRDAQQ